MHFIYNPVAFLLSELMLNGDPFSWITARSRLCHWLMADRSYRTIHLASKRTKTERNSFRP
jgi:hypothetical protein